MVVSGILLGLKSGTLAELETELDRRDWAELHHRDGDRCVITIDADDTDHGIERLKEIQKLDCVLMADMVHHYFGEEAVARAALIGDSVLEAINLTD